MFPNWNWSLIAVSVSFHSVAILSTVFRLWYRWYTAHMWWDDAWAMLALLADVAFLIASVLERPISHESLPRFFSIGNWAVSFAYPTLMWATRISILASIMRVSHPEGVLRYVTISIGAFFGVMGVGTLAARTQLCVVNACLMTRAVFIAQTATDCVADVLLSALPIWFLRNLKLSRKGRILISSALSASMVINIVTIIEAVAVFQLITSGSIVFEHVKVACSMMVCNLLVIAIFIYRILHGSQSGTEGLTPGVNGIEFSTVVLAHGASSEEMSMGWSLPPASERAGSSAWSFRDGSSKASRSVIAPISRLRAEWEE